MTQFRCWVLGFSFVAVLASGASVSAAPIEITSGFLEVGGAEFESRGFLRSIGYDLLTDEFELAWIESDGIPQNVFAPRLVTPSEWTPTGGDTQLVGVLSELTFAAIPSLTPTPFQMTGALTFFALETSDVLFTGTVFGSGNATWRFDLTPFGDSVVSGVRYEFEAAAVPEPATVLLLGAGLAVVIARRQRFDRKLSL